MTKNYELGPLLAISPEPPTVRLTAPQVAALHTAGVFDVEGDALRPFIKGLRITVTEHSIALVNLHSNELDQLSSEETWKTRAGWYNTDARVLANLMLKMSEVHRSWLLACEARAAGAEVPAEMPQEMPAEMPHESRS